MLLSMSSVVRRCDRPMVVRYYQMHTRPYNSEAPWASRRGIDVVSRRHRAGKTGRVRRCECDRLRWKPDDWVRRRRNGCRRSCTRSSYWSSTAPTCAESRSRSARRRTGVRLNEHLEHPEGEVVFRHACKMGLEGIVSKRLGSRYRSGRSPDWLKFKNPQAPAVKREAEEDWGR